MSLKMNRLIEYCILAILLTQCQQISASVECFLAKSSCSKPNELFGKPPSTGGSISCLCDEFCPIFGDCCSNWREVNENSSLVVERRYDNRTLYSICNSKYNAWMITQCPENADPEMKEKCENADTGTKNVSSIEFLELAWVESHASMLSYRNIYCALCHKDVGSVEFINADLFCNGVNTTRLSNNYNYTVEDAVNIIKADDSCSLVRNPGAYDRFCTFASHTGMDASQGPYVRQCKVGHNKNNSIVQECLFGQAVLTKADQVNLETSYYHQGLYRNPACVRCNEFRSNQLMSETPCISLLPALVIPRPSGSFSANVDHSVLNPSNDYVCQQKTSRNDVTSFIDVLRNKIMILLDLKCKENATPGSLGSNSFVENINVAASYLSIISSVVSVLGLLVLLCLYAKYGCLRDNVGLCVILLCVSMLIVSVFELAAAIQSKMSLLYDGMPDAFCQFRAYASYYFDMNSVALILAVSHAIMASNKLWKKGCTDTTLKDKVRVCETLICFICAHAFSVCATTALIVPPLVVANISSEWKPAILENECSLGYNRISSIYVDAITTIVCLIALIMFLITLRKHTKVNNSLMIITKLAVLFGIPGIVGVLAQWLTLSMEAKQVLITIYIVLHGIRGLLLFLVFLVTKQMKLAFVGGEKYEIRNEKCGVGDGKCETIEVEGITNEG